jgi:hypothetical protein
MYFDVHHSQIVNHAWWQVCFGTIFSMKLKCPLHHPWRICVWRKWKHSLPLTCTKWKIHQKVKDCIIVDRVSDDSCPDFTGKDPCRKEENIALLRSPTHVTFLVSHGRGKRAGICEVDGWRLLHFKESNPCQTMGGNILRSRYKPAGPSGKARIHGRERTRQSSTYFKLTGLVQHQPHQPAVVRRVLSFCWIWSRRNPGDETLLIWTKPWWSRRSPGDLDETLQRNSTHNKKIYNQW